MRKGMILALVALGFSLAAETQAQERQALVVAASNVTAQEAGRETTQGVVTPGDILEYRLTFTNIQTGNLVGVVFNNPIPDGLTYVLGTATADRGDVSVEFSIDGGESWSASPEVEVEEGGERVRRPAPARDYTHVRWTLNDPVAAGAQVTASFRAEARSRTPGGR